jgi:hypothetical protein
MNGVDVIQMSLTNGHNVLNGTMAGVTAAVANWVPPGEAHPVAERYAHALWGEDMVIHQMLQGKPMLWESGGHRQRTGIAPLVPMVTKEQARSFKVTDALLTQLQSYAQAVAASTEAYLKGLKDADLDRKVPTGFAGDQPVAWLLSMLVLDHINQVIGEIAAIKGAQGVKGLPF